MKRHRPTALEAQWERRLAAEGLGERSLFQTEPDQAVQFVSTTVGWHWRSHSPANSDRQGTTWEEARNTEIYGRQVAWHELASAEVWQTLEHQAQTLPVPDARDLVTAYCEDGNLSATARRLGVSRSRAVWLLALANRHWRLLQARTAPGDSYTTGPRRRAQAAGL